VPPDFKHASQAGGDLSDYLPPDKYHAAKKGPDRSDYVPGDWVHSEAGNNPTAYGPPR
jgi:hypothetical protein